MTFNGQPVGIWFRSGRHVMVCNISYSNHYTMPRSLTRRSDLFGLRKHVSMGSQQTVRWGFKEFENGFLVFAVGHFPWSFPERSTKLAKLNPVADTRLYRDPYCNGIWENRCIFWTFFGSVGPHKRYQTLLAITSDNKYICNIKIKMKIFSAWFSSDFELDLHLKKWWFLQ